VKIFLIGKTGSINHWLEDAVTAFRGDWHQIKVGAVRRAWLNAGLESAMAEPLAASMAGTAARFAPDLILSIGGFHAPTPFLERLAALPGRPPLAGWVGDLFDGSARRAAELYDLVAYTDSALMARHGELGFPSRTMFLPHAAKPGPAPPPAERVRRMVFVANATPGRRVIVGSTTAPLSVFGPGWTVGATGGHDVHPGRVAHQRVAGLYAGHLASLNIRNEFNVLNGLNQRSFDPYLSATPVVTDDQADLERCFEPGEEVLVYRDADQLNGLYDRLLRDPAEAARIGEAGRRRVLAEHGFAHRLAALRAAL
jgi:spore maturation protein CgeB